MILVRFPFYTDKAAALVDEFARCIETFLMPCDGYPLMKLRGVNRRAGRLDTNGQVVIGFATMDEEVIDVFSEHSEGKIDWAWAFRRFLMLKTSEWWDDCGLLPLDVEKLKRLSAFAEEPKLSDEFTGSPLDPFTSELVKSREAALLKKLKADFNYFKWHLATDPLLSIARLTVGEEVRMTLHETGTDLRWFVMLKLMEWENAYGFPYSTGLLPEEHRR